MHIHITAVFKFYSLLQTVEKAKIRPFLCLFYVVSCFLILINLNFLAFI